MFFLNRAVKWAIIIRLEPFFNGLKEEIQGFQSVQKRLQTDNYCPLYDPFKNIFLVSEKP